MTGPSQRTELRPNDASGLWLATTEHGTKIWISFDDRLWLRDSVGGPNPLPGDGRWRRLGWGPYLATWPQDGTRPRLTRSFGERGIRVGLAVSIGEGLDPALHHWTTHVQSVEHVDEATLPYAARVDLARIKRSRREAE